VVGGEHAPFEQNPAHEVCGRTQLTVRREHKRLSENLPEHGGQLRLLWNRAVHFEREDERGAEGGRERLVAAMAEMASRARMVEQAAWP